MDFWHGFAVFTAVHLLAAASPGPDFAYVTRQSLVHGRQAGFLASLGIALGLSIHIVYSAAGLAAVIAHSAQWMTAIKLIGAAYLLWLGYKGLRSGAHGPTARPRRPRCPPRPGARSRADFSATRSTRRRLSTSSRCSPWCCPRTAGADAASPTACGSWCCSGRGSRWWRWYSRITGARPPARGASLDRPRVRRGDDRPGAARACSPRATDSRGGLTRFGQSRPTTLS